MKSTIASLADGIGILLVIIVLAAVTALGQNTVGWVPQGSLFAEGATYGPLLLLLAGVSILLGLLLSWTKSRSGARAEKLALARGEVLRHTADDIVLHWLNTIGFLACLYSALVLLRWIGNPLGLTADYELHYVGAALVLIAALAYVVQHQVVGNTGLLPRAGDLKGATIEVLEYLDIVGQGERTVLGLRLPSFARRPLNVLASALGLAEAPRPGKYLPTERAFSFSGWTVLLVLVIGSGLIKLARYSFAIPGEVLRWSTLVHDAVVPLLIAALVVHVLAVLLVPANRALMRSMLTGRVPGIYVKEHHPAWYAELEEEGEGQLVAAPERSVQPQ